VKEIDDNFMNNQDMQPNQAQHGKKDFIFASCKRWHLPLFDRLKIDHTENWSYVSNDIELEEALTSTNPKYIFFLHWNWIVPEQIWRAHECVCFHMTDVPYGRGGSPLQNLILAGHTQTMLTALRMVEQMDAGPVYTKKPLSLDGSAEEIYLYAGKLSVEIIQWMIEHNPQPTPQEGEVVIFKRRKPEQSNLPNLGNLQNAYDFIRMLDADGYPTAFIEHGDYLMNFRKAKLDGDRIVAEVEIKVQNKV
jgi:methionyl-tRNA formyltransferase